MPSEKREKCEVFDLLSGDPGVLDEIQAFYGKNGFVVMRALSDTTCKDCIKEQVGKILLKQPMKDEYRLKVHKMRFDSRERVYRSTDEMIDFDTHPDDYIKNLLVSPIDPATRERYKNSWTLHRGFGACCDNVVFHLPHVWEIRQNPQLFQVACRLMGGRDDLWVDINRSIHKLPEEGENEFLHWDISNIFGDFIGDQGVQGKGVYTDSQFFCVPGTHTKEFHTRFVKSYRPLYTDKPNAPKFKLDKSKDPFNLCEQSKTYLLPGGCVLFWSSRLLHGQKKTPKDAPIEFGTYLGYMVAQDRPQYAKAALKWQEHIDQRFGGEGKGYLAGRPLSELADRLYSYEHGVAPILWPSLDPIHFYPYRFENLHNHLLSILEKMTDRARVKYECTEYLITKKDRTIQSIRPWKNKRYVAPQLTELGRKLLGLDFVPKNEVMPSIWVMSFQHA